MALTKRSESNTVFLQAKHYCLWQEIKSQVDGCESVQVKNPKTDAVSTKYGYKFNTVYGLVTALVKYDTEKKYPTRFFGFKLHLRDGDDSYVLDMPYQSQLLRRFLRIAPNVNWNNPLSITIFKGKKENGTEELGVWFQQQGETVRVYFTRENPRGMPAATQDPDTHEWDFRAQHRWLVERLKTETIPDIDEAAKRAAPPIQPAGSDAQEPFAPEPEQPEPHHRETLSTEITDDDVPF